MLDLPAAKYDLADLCQSGDVVPGSISYSLIREEDEIRISIEDFLKDAVPLYTTTSDFTPKKVIDTLSKFDVGLPPGYEVPDGINNGADLYVGILLLDAAIANSDRHDENLDIVRDEDGNVYLSPAFDQGFSLGAFEDNDLRDYINAEFYTKYHSFSFVQGEGKREITGLQAFATAANERPEAAAVWLRKLADINSEKVDRIFDRVPSDRINPDAKKFAKSLFKYNQKDLVEFGMSLDAKLQQARVEEIVPILGAYLKHCQKNRVENAKTIVEWVRDRKTISYQDKVNPLEVLKAQYVDGKWRDCGSKISASKADYFRTEAGPKVRALTTPKLDLLSVNR